MVHHDVPKLKELSLLERLREQISDHVQARWYEYSRRPPQDEHHSGRNTSTARQIDANRHREWLHRPEQADLRAAVRRELRGLRLGCWCEQPGPCHGHNLFEVADADFDASGDNSTL